MLDILDQYLSTTVPMELKTAIEQAHAVIDRVDIPNYEQGFEELLMIDDNTDSGGTQAAIVQLTIALLHKILMEHTVRVSEDTPLDMLTQIVTGVMDLQTYDNKQEMLKTVSGDGAPEELFAEVMALVTCQSAEELLSHIESVSQFLITRIKEISTEDDETNITDDERKLKSVLMTDLTCFCIMVDDHDLYANKMLESGMDVGYPFIVYADMVGREFEGMDPKQAAKELFAFALISVDGNGNPRAIINENLEQYVTDIDHTTRINMAVGDLELEKSHAKN